MKGFLVALGLFALAVPAAYAQDACDPQCAQCAPECCVPKLELLVYEVAASGQPHFVIGDGTELTEVKGLTPSFVLTNAKISTVLGGVLQISFVVSTQNTVKFITSNGGQCVGMAGTKGFQDPKNNILVDGRSLDVNKPAFFCREPGRDLLCFQVKGQARPPFPPLPIDVVRVEDLCGLATLS